MNDYQKDTLDMLEDKKRRAESNLESKSKEYYEGYEQAFRDFIVNSKQYPEL